MQKSIRDKKNLITSNCHHFKVDFEGRCQGLWIPINHFACIWYFRFLPHLLISTHRPITTHDATPSEGHCCHGFKNKCCNSPLFAWILQGLDTIVRFHLNEQQLTVDIWWEWHSLTITSAGFKLGKGVSWQTYSRDMILAEAIRSIGMGFTCVCKVSKRKKPHNL